MSVLFYKAIQKEITRLHRLKATSDEDTIAEQIQELKARAGKEDNLFIKQLMEKEINKLETQEAKGSLPAYVGEVLPHLEAALESMETFPAYTEGLRRGRKKGGKK